jgi:hypothetical protein
LSIIDKEIDDSITEQLKRFENLKQKLEESPELQKQMTNNLDKLRRQSRLIHSDILKQLIDKMELLIIDDQDMMNALGYKMYIEHLISLVQHIWSLVAYAVSDWTFEGLVCASFGGMQRLAQNVTGVKVPLSGHWIPEEWPDFVVTMLNDFFGDANIRK